MLEKADQGTFFASKKLANDLYYEFLSHLKKQLQSEKSFLIPRNNLIDNSPSINLSTGHPIYGICHFILKNQQAANNYKSNVWIDIEEARKYGFKPVTRSTASVVFKSSDKNSTNGKFYFKDFVNVDQFGLEKNQIIDFFCKKNDIDLSFLTKEKTKKEILKSVDPKEYIKIYLRSMRENALLICDKDTGNVFKNQALKLYNHKTKFTVRDKDGNEYQKTVNSLRKTFDDAIREESQEVKKTVSVAQKKNIDSRNL